jgi:hypothetical protein
MEARRDGGTAARMLQRAAGPCAVGQRVEGGPTTSRSATVRDHDTRLSGQRGRVHAHAQQRGVARPVLATAAHSSADSTAEGQHRAAAAAQQ